jgi:hypothetical protein
MKTKVMRFNGTAEHDPAIDAWFPQHAGELGDIAHYWWNVMRHCGDEVREVLHDGFPTACLGDVAFDPAHLLQGTGKMLRHVKLRPDTPTDEAALHQLIHAAYSDIKMRVEPG